MCQPDATIPPSSFDAQLLLSQDAPCELKTGYTLGRCCVMHLLTINTMKMFCVQTCTHYICNAFKNKHLSINPLYCDVHHSRVRLNNATALAAFNLYVVVVVFLLQIIRSLSAFFSPLVKQFVVWPRCSPFVSFFFFSFSPPKLHWPSVGQLIQWGRTTLRCWV